MADLKCGDIYTHRDLKLFVARTVDDTVFLQVIDKSTRKGKPIAHFRLRKGEALYLKDKLIELFDTPAQAEMLLTSQVREC